MTAKFEFLITKERRKIDKKIEEQLGGMLLGSRNSKEEMIKESKFLIEKAASRLISAKASALVRNNPVESKEKQ